MDKKGKGKNKGKKEKDSKEDNKKGGKDQKLKTCNFVKARHILCSKQSQIEEIFNKLNEEYGMNPPASEFGKLAQEYSECSSKKKGGELGYFGRGKMVHEFEEAAFSTPPGQMSNIIKTVHGYHIILVEDRKASIK
jgi:parvulin-like peptidyl-prolyl isomerase